MEKIRAANGNGTGYKHDLAQLGNKLVQGPGYQEAAEGLGHVSIYLVWMWAFFCNWIDLKLPETVWKSESNVVALW